MRPARDGDTPETTGSTRGDRTDVERALARVLSRLRVLDSHHGNSKVIQQTCAMVNRENVDPGGTNAIDDTVIAAKDFPYLIAPQLRNDLAGIRKIAEPCHRFTQSANEGDCRYRRIPGDERSDFAQVLTSLSRPDDSS